MEQLVGAPSLRGNKGPFGTSDRKDVPHVTAVPFNERSWNVPISLAAWQRGRALYRLS